MNDAATFPTLEIRKAASLIHYYYFWRQHVESSREATFFCCPQLITIAVLFRPQYCLQDTQNLRRTCTCRKNLRALFLNGAQFAVRTVVSNLNNEDGWVSK